MMSERIISNTQILAEIRAEREALEKIKVDLEQPRRGALCGAKTSAGTPCRRRPTIGCARCALHGGGSPLARQAAERRLLLGTSLALDRLIDAVSEHEHDGPCALCGCNASARDPVVIRAAIAVLDRSGFGPNLTLHTTEEEVRVDEVRVTIVDVDPVEREKEEASVRALRAARTAKYNRKLDESEPEPTEGKGTLLIDMETDQ